MKTFEYSVKVITTVVVKDNLNRFLSCKTDCTQGDPHKL